jgi:hypothetical protein
VSRTYHRDGRRVVLLTPNDPESWLTQPQALSAWLDGLEALSPLDSPAVRELVAGEAQRLSSLRDPEKAAA